MTAPPGETPPPDYVGLAARAMAMAVLLGTGWNALVGLTIRTMQIDRPPAPTPSPNDPTFTIVLAGTFIGLVIAALTTYTMLAPVKSPYRQGMLAILSAFATLLISLITQPVDMTFGRAGLGVLAAVAFLVALMLWRGRPRFARSHGH